MGNAVGHLAEGEEDAQEAAALHLQGVSPVAHPARAFIVANLLYTPEEGVVGPAVAGRWDEEAHSSADLSEALPPEVAEAQLLESQTLLVELWRRRLAVHAALQVAEELYAGAEGAAYVQYNQACAALARPAESWWKRHRVPPRLTRSTDPLAEPVVHTVAAAAITQWLLSVKGAISDGSGQRDRMVEGAAAVAAWAEFIARNPLAAAAFASATVRYEEAARAKRAGAHSERSAVVTPLEGAEAAGGRDAGAGAEDGTGGTGAQAHAGDMEFMQNGRLYKFTAAAQRQLGTVVGTAPGAAMPFEAPDWRALEEDELGESATRAVAPPLGVVRAAEAAAAAEASAAGPQALQVQRLRGRVAQLEAQLRAEESARNAAETRAAVAEDGVAGAEGVLGAATAATAAALSALRAARGQAAQRSAALRLQLAAQCDDLERLRWEAAEVAEAAADEFAAHRAAAADVARVAQEIAGETEALRPMLAEAFLALADAEDRASGGTERAEEAAAAAEDAKVAADARALEAQLHRHSAETLALEASSLRDHAAAALADAAAARAAQHAAEMAYARERAQLEAMNVQLANEAAGLHAQLAGIRRNIAGLEGLRGGDEGEARPQPREGGAAAAVACARDVAHMQDAEEVLSRYSASVYSDTTFSEVGSDTAAINPARREEQLRDSAEGTRKKLRFEALKQQRNRLRAQLKVARQELDTARAESKAVQAVKVQLRSLQDALYL